MRLTAPYPANVPGDNLDEYTTTNGTLVRARIMARSPRLVGVRGDEAVWAFGFAPGSEQALAYERESPEVFEPGGHGPFFVRATVKTASIRETFRGYYLEMPASMRRVANEPEPDTHFTLYANDVVQLVAHMRGSDTVSFDVDDKGNVTAHVAGKEALKL